MATFATRIENRVGAALSPEQIFEIARAREEALARLLMLYIVTGLAFMLLPGTFLGVWNLIAITSHEAADSISASWIQAHGSAQIFGWIGTFILGIGFYSIPKLRRMEPFALWTARLCWGLWTGGVLLRWFGNVYAWHWRLLVPASAAMQVAAFVLFFHSVSGHKPPRVHGLEVLKPVGGRYARFELWAVIVIAATVGLMMTLAANLAGAIYVALYAATPAFPPSFDARFLILAAWGFLVPFVWGFSTKWLPIFLGLKAARNRLLAGAFAVNALGVVVALFGRFRVSAILIALASLLAPMALRLFEANQQKPKLQGVHSSFPAFVRIAYVWAILGAALAVWTAWARNATGIGGAARHALTVGFLAMMVLNIGQRILPAFSGMRLLFSTRLMFISSLLLALGCALRVSCEILAYQGFAAWAWHCLPVSAVIELTAVTLFFINLVLTFLRPPAPQMIAARQSA